jgi:hypothetical protein
VDASAFAQAALREGVALVTAAAITVDRSTPTYVRLPLALDDGVIEDGVERLGRAYRGFSQSDGLPARAPRLVV